MDVMKGIDPVAASSKLSSTAVPGEEGWVTDGLKGKEGEKRKSRRERIAEKKSEADAGTSRKGKEKSVEPVVEEVDDDVAWLARRRVALDEDAAADSERAEGEGLREAEAVSDLVLNPDRRVE
jgi:hypothetical protein